MTTTPVTKEMALGTLVHRAVLWPFIEPAHGPRLWRMKDPGVLADIVQRNVRVITRACRARQSPTPEELISADLFSAIVDRTGGATSQGAELLANLTRTELSWVMQKLPAAGAQAADALAADIRTQNYLTLRSEVPTQDLDWEPAAHGQPRQHQRLDLVGLTENGQLEIIELKVTGRMGHHDGNDFPQIKAQLGAVRSRLGDDRRPIRGRLLYVYAEGGRHSWNSFTDQPR